MNNEFFNFLQFFFEFAILEPHFDEILLEQAPSGAASLTLRGPGGGACSERCCRERQQQALGNGLWIIWRVVASFGELQRVLAVWRVLARFREFRRVFGYLSSLAEFERV